MAQHSVPVAIIGAGPTGLSMAVELQRCGIPFRIFDKQNKPVISSNALAIQTRTLEVWDDLNLISIALKHGIKITEGNIFSGDKTIGEIQFNKLNSFYHFVLGLSQHQTEKMLLSQLAEKHIFVEMHTELKDLIQTKDGITLVIADVKGEDQIHAEWVIACDGAHSWVREKCNIAFAGKELPQHFVLADLEIETEFTKNRLNLFTSPKGILATIPFDAKYTRLIADTTDDPELKTATRLTFAQIQRLVAERCSFQLKMKDPVWTSGFWIHERMVKTMQSGQIFFAGDSAHIHSPAGGQGMNTGIQDANNLAWKLALVIKKQADATILQTYDSERKAVAKKVLRNTTLLTRMMTLRNPILLRLRNMMISSILNSASRQKKMINTLAQLNIAYAESALVKEYLPHQSGPKAGTRLLDVSFHQHRLFDFVRGPNIALLYFMGMEDQADIALYYDLDATLRKHFSMPLNSILIRGKNQFEDWGHTFIFDEDNKIHTIYGANEPCIYLIRPDKYIGFRGGLKDLTELKQWLALNIA